ncbi:MAG: hypothetical protein IPL87_02235 [Candidatus Moraniibacteriota bacterium]|nr:MAG: hypothetical protein IPL87_02235 [Candidatus Moranbacteria bacterium]
MDHRSQKKLVFGIAYALLFFGIAYLLYLPFKPPVTCSDGKKNQNETGVDCGGVCAVCIEEPVLQDIQVTEASWVVGGKGNTYDLVAKMENPNNDYGASLVPYEFVVKDAGGTVIFKQKGESFILPREEKYVIEPTLTLSGKPATVEFSTGRPLGKVFRLQRKTGT